MFLRIKDDFNKDITINTNYIAFFNNKVQVGRENNKTDDIYYCIRIKIIDCETTLLDYRTEEKAKEELKKINEAILKDI